MTRASSGGRICARRSAGTCLLLPNALLYLVLLALLGITPAACSAQDRVALDSVSVDDGNVVLQRGDERVQLTSAGSALEAVLSTDGRRIAFVRATPDEIIATGRGPEEARELWVADADTLAPKSVLKGRDAESMTDVIAAIRDLRFSADGRFIFFISAAWATSDAVHRVDLSDESERFVSSGYRYEVLTDGEFPGNLLVHKRQYRSGSGRSDRYVVLTFDGDELAPAPADLVLRVWPGDAEELDGR